MAIGKALAERREQSILAHAAPYLEEGEYVVHWARARSLTRRRDGFMFVTDKRCIVHWTGRDDGHFSAAWTEVEGWGVDPDARGGPVVQLDHASGPAELQLRVSTAGMAASANDVLQFASDRITGARRDLQTATRRFRSWGDLTVTPQPRSLKDHTRRVLVTVVGLLLLVGGIAITPLPGPWSFPIILGGLAVLASEYDWAQDLLTWVKLKYKTTKEKLRTRRSPG